MRRHGSQGVRSPEPVRDGVARDCTEYPFPSVYRCRATRLLGNRLWESLPDSLIQKSLVIEVLQASGGGTFRRFWHQCRLESLQRRLPLTGWERREPLVESRSKSGQTSVPVVSGERRHIRSGRCRLRGVCARAQHIGFGKRGHMWRRQPGNGAQVGREFRQRCRLAMVEKQAPGDRRPLAKPAQ